ncbi:unnamed protein product, partial [Oppiella nova]
LVYSDAIRILLQILNETNRSEPHKQIIALTVNILLNIAKYDKTCQDLNVKKDKRKVEAIKQISDYSMKDKSFKKYKLRTNYKFCPNWQIGKRNVYEFDNNFIAIQVMVRRLNI